MMDGNTLQSGMCRCCSSEGTFKDIKTKYHWMGEEEVYADMLTDCFDIKISTPENMDNGICEVCITQLRNAANFKKQVLHTEEQFKKRLQGLDIKNPIKLESVEDPIESDHLSDPDFSGAEYDVPIKEEEDVKPKAKKRPAKPAATRAKKAKPEAETSKQRVARRTRIITIDATNQKADLKLKQSPNILRLSRVGSVATKKNQHNLGQILLNSNVSPIRLHNPKGYMCAVCPKQFPEPRDLKKHFLEEHNDDRLIKRMSGSLHNHVVKLDITLLNCALCDTDFDILQDFMLHLIAVHDKQLYMDVQSQLLPFKFDTPELRCAICSATHGSFKLLQQHMNWHFRNYICNICNAGFVGEHLLMNHIRRHGDSQVECPECGKTFINEQKMREHEKRTHLGFDKRNKCKFCSERFSDYWKKVNHMVKEHGVPQVVLKCQACERTFDNQRSLSRHTKKDHLMERKHKCSYCDMKFFSTSCLNKHLPKHTGIKQFKCGVCSKAFGRKTTLTEHMRIHADDRRFSCRHCGQAFIQKCSLKGHLRSKHGEIL